MSTYTTEIAALNLIQPAEQELLAEIRGGRDIDELAAELAAEDCASGIPARDIARALRNLVERRAQG